MPAKYKFPQEFKVCPSDMLITVHANYSTIPLLCIFWVNLYGNDLIHGKTREASISLIVNVTWSWTNEFVTWLHLDRLFDAIPFSHLTYHESSTGC